MTNKKLTHTEYLRRLEEQVKPKYGKYPVPLEEYKTSETRIKHKCECGAIYKTAPYIIYAGKNLQCPPCGRAITRSKTTKSKEQYIQDLLEIKETYGIAPTLVGEYVNSKTATLHKCKCGNTYMAIPNTILSKPNTTGNKINLTCLECGNKRKGQDQKTHLSLEEYNEQLKQLGQEVGYWPVAITYNTALTKAKHICPLCNNIYETYPCNVKRAGKVQLTCPVCSKGNSSKISQQWIEDICKEFNWNIKQCQYTTNGSEKRLKLVQRKKAGDTA